jgi:hypothetical protein
MLINLAFTAELRTPIGMGKRPMRGVDRSLIVADKDRVKDGLRSSGSISIL